MAVIVEVWSKGQPILQHRVADTAGIPTVLRADIRDRNLAQLAQILYVRKPQRRRNVDDECAISLQPS